ncbi:MAG: putative dual-specificity RNA methyltransferase RlmN [Firmicutes bacterium ADurb.Bin467]|nr:MAG: putative dual-specificity RNA methyltransferase RlmN [Firmicutes bacterium ADurb.Bin467]
MVELLSLTQSELREFLAPLDKSAFRARQVGEWLSRGRKIPEMTNLPAKLREQMSEIAVANPVSVREVRRSEVDDTEKFLYALPDGNIIEGVLMRYHHGDTLCLSTQVGCRMGCRFCASTIGGCARNLSPGEMLGQVACANRHIEADGRKVHNVVLMGSGEPLDNYENTVKFLRLLNAPERMNLSLRNVSLSTCGLVPQMRRFAGEGLPVTLSVSLHAPNDEIRRKLMPIANAYPIAEVVSAAREYVEKTGRRAIFEYALVRGMNCELRHADELAQLLRGLQCHVNLIPLNGVRERELMPPGRREAEAFLNRLELRHISATIRREMGADIEGACGQLRRSALDKDR